MSCVHCEPGLRPGAAYSYWYVVLTATKSSPRITSGCTGFIRWQSCGPSTIRLRLLLPCDISGVFAAGRVGFVLVPRVAADAVAVRGDHLARSTPRRCRLPSASR